MAELHRLDSGHFAVEDCLDVIAQHIRRFYNENVATSDATRRIALALRLSLFGRVVDDGRVGKRREQSHGPDRFTVSRA